MTTSAREEGLESAWRQRLARFAQSGQTIKAFCQQESVSAWSFYHWRRRLQEPAAPSGTDAAAAAFVDLGAVSLASPRVEAAAPTGAANLTIRLDLPGGVVLTIARG
jgi:transposase-like protein